MKASSSDPWENASARRTITLADFLTTVSQNEGEILPTISGKAAFTVSRKGDGVRFTPTSSGQPRNVNATDLQSYLDVFNETGSTKTTSYTTSMFNPSYVLPVITLWLGQQAPRPLSSDETIDGGQGHEADGFAEGKTALRSHQVRERSPELVRLAKVLFKNKHGGRLFCEVCGFDFGLVYGEPDFIEAHHRVPLCDLQPSALTKISDLAMVCANCHRMLHRGPKWLSIPELKAKIDSAKAKRKRSADQL